MVENAQKTVQFSITGQDPLEASSALYSNFVGISRVGTDVQMEFIFLDLNQVAVVLEREKQEDKSGERVHMQGKTVAKVVMPGPCFLQLRNHVNMIFDAIEKAMKKEEVTDVRRAGNL